MSVRAAARDGLCTHYRALLLSRVLVLAVVAVGGKGVVEVVSGVPAESVKSQHRRHHSKAKTMAC